MISKRLPTHHAPPNSTHNIKILNISSFLTFPKQTDLLLRDKFPISAIRYSPTNHHPLYAHRYRYHIFCCFDCVNKYFQSCEARNCLLPPTSKELLQMATSSSARENDLSATQKDRMVSLMRFVISWFHTSHFIFRLLAPTPLSLYTSANWSWTLHLKSTIVHSHWTSLLGRVWTKFPSFFKRRLCT